MVTFLWWSLTSLFLSHLLTLLPLLLLVRKQFNAVGCYMTKLNAKYLSPTPYFLKKLFLKFACTRLQGVCACMPSHVWLFCDPRDCNPPRLLCPWDFPDKNTRLGCHFLLQGIFLTQESNPHLLHWQVDSLPLGHQWRIYLPDKGLNLSPLHCEHEVLATGPLGKAPQTPHFLKTKVIKTWLHVPSSSSCGHSSNSQLTSVSGSG